MAAAVGVADEEEPIDVVGVLEAAAFVAAFSEAFDEDVDEDTGSDLADSDDVLIDDVNG